MVSDHTSSVLRNQNTESMENFTWDPLLDELQVHAPYLFQLLSSFTQSQSEKTRRLSLEFVLPSY